MINRFYYICIHSFLPSFLHSCIHLFYFIVVFVCLSLCCVVCVCVCVCVCARARVCVCVCACARVCVRACICVRARARARACVCVWLICISQRSWACLIWKSAMEIKSLLLLLLSIFLFFLLSFFLSFFFFFFFFFSLTQVAITFNTQKHFLMQNYCVYIYTNLLWHAARSGPGPNEVHLLSCNPMILISHYWRKSELFCCFVCWLLIVPATCECISGTDLHRQFYVLPHWDRKLQIKLSISPSHSILTPGRPVPVLTL